MFFIDIGTCDVRSLRVATSPFTFFSFLIRVPKALFPPPPCRFFRIYRHDPARYAAVLREHGTFARRGYASVLVSASTTPPSFLFLMGHVTREITEGGGRERDP